MFCFPIFLGFIFTSVMSLSGSQFSSGLTRMTRKKKSPSPYDRINIDDDDEMIIEGYLWSLTRSFVFWFSGLLSAGFVFMLTTWKPSYLIKFTHKRCTLDQADRVILRVINIFSNQRVKLNQHSSIQSIIIINVNTFSFLFHYKYLSSLLFIIQTKQIMRLNES